MYVTTEIRILIGIDNRRKMSTRLTMNFLKLLTSLSLDPEKDPDGLRRSDGTLKRRVTGGNE